MHLILNVMDPAADDPPLSRGALARVRNLQSSFTPAERAIAAFVTHHPKEVIHISVDALAQRAQVSTTTVMRFCQSVGFDGFKDFKIALATEMGGGAAALPEDVREGDTPLEIAKKSSWRTSKQSHRP